MSYAERRKSKLTGRWFGEEIVRGKRFRRGFDTKHEADGFEGYVRAAGSDEGFVSSGDKHTGVTFREVAEQCKAAGGARKGRWKAGRDPSTFQRLELVVDALGDLDIAAVGTLQLDGLVNGLQRRPGYQGRALSPATINRYLAAASSVLTFASQRGYIQGKPVVPLQTEDGAREGTVSPELEEAVIKRLGDQGHTGDALCVRVLIETGMRAGELDGLDAEQIGDEWISLRASQVKTKQARRVWIRPELARDLRALITAGARPTARHLASVFKKAVKAVGGSSELVIHSLRHTRATRLLEAGTDPQVTMQMMGWTSFVTMMRYRHVQPSMHAEAAKKVALRVGDFAENGVILPFAKPISA